GDYIRRMIDTFLGGDIEAAAAMQRKLYPLLKVMGQNGRTNPVCLWKDAIRLTGGNAGLPRLPLSPGTPEEIEEVRKALVTFGAL
ncbi:MAG: dihydrodipicolinate synthase family protein, partial [Tropicimonas sp.]|uniref:dihydrodipicolinate synthase family protein n=1 Tax=Tropicimonas sp. TaxID=2067044 RepID=UPI003A87BFDC